jgi:manganese/zinc/iron transport system substrate-binding protein
MTFRRFPIGVLVFCSAVVFLGCNGGRDSQSTAESEQVLGKPIQVTTTYQGKDAIQVACTTEMVADLVRNVGKGRVTVQSIMGEGVDPHLYKATPGDRELLAKADIIFYSGLHLEGKMTEILANMGKKKPSIAVAEHVPAKLILKDEDGHMDPHLWFDVDAWSHAAGVVRDVLVKFDPPHADEYRRNAEQYQKELADLHGYAKAQLESIPKERRVLVTAHDAFRYFGRAYDVEVRGIQGISTENEAGVKSINELVQLLTERRIKAVFVETSVSDRNIKALLEGSRAKGHSVAIGGELYSDAMGKAGTPGGTFVGMVRHNVDTIVKALK